MEVKLDDEPDLCPLGWYFKKDTTGCNQDFVNTYSVKSGCVNGGDAVDIHTSCSCDLELCTDFQGYVFTGYNVPSKDASIWIVSPDK